MADRQPTLSQWCYPSDLNAEIMVPTLLIINPMNHCSKRRSTYLY